MQGKTEEEKLEKELKKATQMHEELLTTYFNDLFVSMGPFDEAAQQADDLKELEKINQADEMLSEVKMLQREINKTLNLRTNLSRIISSTKRDLDAQKQSTFERLNSSDRKHLPLPQTQSDLHLILTNPEKYQQKVMPSTQDQFSKGAY